MKKKLLLIALPLLLMLAGCKKNVDNPTEPEISNSSNPTGQPMPSFVEQPDYNGAMATIQYSMASPIAGLPSVSMSMAFASFGAGVDAGAVKVNTNILAKLSSGGKTYYISPDPNNPLANVTLGWGNSDHTWNVAGGSTVPAITGSVKSPSDFSLISPVAGATVTKTNGIQVKWSSSSSAKVLVQLVSVSQSASVKVYQELADNGSFTIPSSDISGFNGDCLLYVVKYTYASTTASGKIYYMVSEIVKNLTIKVN